MKKILGVLFLIILFCSTTISFAQTQVESGKWGINVDTPNYTLSKNQGERSMIINVAFDVPFDVKPDIVLSVTLLDASDKTAIRYDVSAMSVSRDGFSIKVVTWSNTIINSISGSWIAHATAK